MQNLVKIQEDLKNLPLQAVMSYVEGRNPMVPPYLALTELNRRKQIQQSQQAQNAQPMPTVKDQVAQQTGLMELQTQRAQQGMQNIAQRAMQVPQPGAVPKNAPVQAAGGGLMSARIDPSMFNRANFAGGGIVAFQEGGEAEELTEEEKKKLEENAYLQRSRALANFPQAVGDFLRRYNPVTGSAYSEGIQRFVSESPESQAQRFRSYSSRPEQRADVTKEVPISPAAPTAVAATPKDTTVDEREANRFKSMADQNKQFQADVARRAAPPAAPVSQAPREGIATLTPPKDIYDQEIERLKKLNEAFGVKEQPTAESDKMIADLRRKIDEQRKDQGLEALTAAMAKGAKGRRWYEASAGFGEGYMEASEKQRKLNNEQDQAFANLQIAKDKEDDARRRGNVKAVQDAVKERQKLEIDAKNAESNRIQALKPSQLKEQIELFKSDPETYAKMYPKENPLVIAAAKTYFEKVQDGLDKKFIEQYPTVNDYVAATVAGYGSKSQTSGASAPPQAAIDALKKDPKLRKQFDEKYGAGASNRYLG